MEVNKKENTLAMEELRAFIKSTVRQQDKVLDALREGQQQNNSSIQQLREAFTTRSTELQNSIESLTTLVSQMSHQMTQLTAAGGHSITPVAKTVSPLGNRWGNGNQLHQQVPNYANKNVLDKTLRQREALTATAAFAHKVANNPEIINPNYNGNNVIRVDGSGKN